MIRLLGPIALLTPMVLFNGLIATVSGQFVPARFEAFQTSLPPVMDGVLDDMAWIDAQPIDQFFEYKSGGTPAASTGIMRLAWDTDYLYVGMTLDDSNLLPSSVITGATGHDAALYEGDVIELFIRQHSDSPQYHEFEWNANGDSFDARFDRVRFGSPGTGWESGQQSAVAVNGTIEDASDTDTGWSVEAAIPLSQFDPVTVDTEWFFSFARYDFFRVGPDSTSAHLMMTTRGDPAARMGGVTAGFHTYEIYDILHFAAATPPKGDFNGNGQLDADDLDQLTSAQEAGDASFDLTGDGQTDADDRIHWLAELKRTWVGDSNLDGVFSSSDLVDVFRVGRFETGEPAGWAEGDWDGNRRFDSADIVFAFQQGGYEQGPLAAARAVPEPECARWVLLASIIGLCRNARRESPKFDGRVEARRRSNAETIRSTQSRPISG